MSEISPEILIGAIKELAAEVEAVKAMVSACSVSVIAAVSVVTAGHPDRLAIATGLAETLEKQKLIYDGSPADQKLRMISAQELLRIADGIRREFHLPPRVVQVPS